jgi:PIN domain nuclease of toxin-antitoxin system
MKEQTIRISSISVWEVAQLVARGRLELTLDVADWVAKSESLPFVHFVPVDNRIAIRATDLPGEFHADPADRIIVATTLVLGATLVTRDERLRRYDHVETLW